MLKQAWLVLAGVTFLIVFFSAAAAIGAGPFIAARLTDNLWWLLLCPVTTSLVGVMVDAFARGCEW